MKSLLILAILSGTPSIETRVKIRVNMTDDEVAKAIGKEPEVRDLSTCVTWNGKARFTCKIYYYGDWRVQFYRCQHGKKIDLGGQCTGTAWRVESWSMRNP
jgi:hypothetical protein